MLSSQIHDYAFSELEYKKFISPSVDSAIALLNIDSGARILDAGCGPGATLLKLLQATKFTGHITGIDASDPHLNVAKELVKEEIGKKQISLLKADLLDTLPFADESFDVVWCSDVLFPDDPGENIADVLKEFKRILRPFGKIAIFYGNWLRLQLLSGYSELEHHISIANELRKSGEYKWTYLLHPENGLSWLQTTGFKNCNVSVHQTLHSSPLVKQIRNYIQWHFENIYDKAIHFQTDSFRMDNALIELWQKISNETSPDYLLKKAGYYCRVSAVLFTGTKD